MEKNTRKHPPGTIGIYTDHIARYSDFTVAISALEAPEGSVFKWSRGVYLAYNTNEFIRNLQGEWLFLMDDDHRFTSATLMKLLDHDLDVVVGLTSKKLPPFDPVIYREGDDGKLRSLHLESGGGLEEIHACGKPGMLIRRHVLEAIPDPWCEYIDSEQGAEDWDLCNKIRAAGFKIYVDLDLPVAHMVPAAVYKMRNPQGQWGTFLGFENDGIFVPDLGE